MLRLESRLKITLNCSDNLNILTREVDTTDDGNSQPTCTGSLSGREYNDKCRSKSVTTVSNRQSVSTLESNQACIIPKLVKGSSCIEQVSDSEDIYEERSSQTEAACPINVNTGDHKPFMMRNVVTKP